MSVDRRDEEQRGLAVRSVAGKFGVACDLCAFAVVAFDRGRRPGGRVGEEQRERVGQGASGSRDAVFGAALAALRAVFCC